jgi:pimeloyl-ACP methyl ester carboxylesterase
LPLCPTRRRPRPSASSASPTGPTRFRNPGDVEAMVNGLDLDRVVLVPHDGSGPAAIKWALDQPDRVAAIVALNTFYGDIAAAQLNPTTSPVGGFIHDDT